MQNWFAPNREFPATEYTCAGLDARARRLLVGCVRRVSDGAESSRWGRRQRRIGRRPTGSSRSMLVRANGGAAAGEKKGAPREGEAFPNCGRQSRGRTRSNIDALASIVAMRRGGIGGVGYPGVETPRLNSHRRYATGRHGRIDRHSATGRRGHIDRRYATEEIRVSVNRG
jgi:hypothetical protein